MYYQIVTSNIFRGRDPIVMLGFLVHVLAYFLIFLNLPDSAPFGDTSEPAFIDSNEYLAMFCSLLLGKSSWRG